MHFGLRIKIVEISEYSSSQIFYLYGFKKRVKEIFRNSVFLFWSRCLIICGYCQINYSSEFRQNVGSRSDDSDGTKTICDGYPLNVHWYSGNGLNVNQNWNPENANGNVGVSVEGVPE